MSEPVQKVRIDKWLWQARHFKSRTIAAKAVSEGRVRVNSKRVVKPSFAVAAGDVLTFHQGRGVRVVRIVALARRRGPAVEALALYDDITPPSEPTAAGPKPLPGRPDRRERRIAAQLKAANLE